MLGSFSGSGISNAPSYAPHNCSVMAGTLLFICLTNVHAVSHTNVIGGYRSDKYKSAASRTDSVSIINFDATVHWKMKNGN